MKKALKINLGGQIFHIDEDAYEKLKIYLDTISRHFNNITESKEIMTDIESRISELLYGKMKDKEQVISLIEVDEIIEIMGRPEEIAADDTTEEEKPRREFRQNRRLYRDPDNAVFGGVSAGLAAYFNLDILLIRILFIVLTILGGGLPVFIYIVLWIAVPKAVTSAQKLEMRGEKVTVSNIEKTVKEEYENVKDNLKRAKNSETFRQTEDFFTKLFHVVAVILKAFLKLFLIFIAIIFVLIGIALLFSTFGIVFFGVDIPFDTGQHFSLSLPEMIQPFFNPTNVVLFVFSISLLVLIPVLSIIYGLFKLLFRFNAKDKTLGIAAFSLWILALIATFSLVFYEGRNFRDNETVSITKNLDLLHGDTLYISVNEALPEDWEDDKTIDLNDKWLFSQDMKELIGTVQIDVKKSSDMIYKVQLRKSSRGSDKEHSVELANKILYTFTQQKDTLNLDSYFRPGEKNQWRMQNLEVVLYVPEGKAVHLGKTTSDYLSDVDNIENIYDKEMAGHTWIMKEEGLSWDLKK